MVCYLLGILGSPDFIHEEIAQFNQRLITFDQVSGVDHTLTSLHSSQWLETPHSVIITLLIVIDHSVTAFNCSRQDLDLLL